MSAYVEEKRHVTVSVAEMLKITREFAGVSQSQLAKLSNVAQSAISAIENGRLELGVERARRLGKAMGVHPGTLLFPGWRLPAQPGVHKAVTTKAKKSASSRSTTRKVA